MDKISYSEIKEILNSRLENSEKVNLIYKVLIEVETEELFSFQKTMSDKEEKELKSEVEKFIKRKYKNLRDFCKVKRFDDNDELDAFKKHLNIFIENSTDAELIEYLKAKANKDMYI